MFVLLILALIAAIVFAAMLWGPEGPRLADNRIDINQKTKEEVMKETELNTHEIHFNDGEIIRVEHADQNMDDVSAEYMDDDGDQILSVQLRQVKYIFNIKATGAIRVMQAGR